MRILKLVHKILKYQPVIHKITELANFAYFCYGTSFTECVIFKIFLREKNELYTLNNIKYKLYSIYIQLQEKFEINSSYM